MANFGATFGKFRATLYIDIWSHCALRPNPFYERINMGQKCYEELDTISWQFFSSVSKFCKHNGKIPIQIILLSNLKSKYNFKCSRIDSTK